MRISDWSSDVCSSDLGGNGPAREAEIIIISGNAFGAQIIAFAFFELRQRYGRIDVVKSDHAPAIILHHFSDRYAIGYIGPDDDSVSVADSLSEGSQRVQRIIEDKLEIVRLRQIAMESGRAPV